VDKIRDKNHISEKTAECIKARTKETKPGAYTEQPKTHKFDENKHDMKKGFPAN
jgi:hypothetical protein